MADGKLQDPDLPAGAIVATAAEDDALAEGQVRRNDGVVLNPAAQNPWYVLATVAGEQEGRWILDIDLDLHARNRRFWNGWMCQNMAEAERAALAEKVGLHSEELVPLTEKERTQLFRRFENAFPAVAEEDCLPDPGTSVDMRSTHFTNAIVLRQCVLARRSTFDMAHFAERADFACADFQSFSGFRDTFFAGPAHFRGAHFAGRADFESAHFVVDADLSDCDFASRTIFDKTHFETRTPKFYHSAVHEDTSFPTTRDNWPKPKNEHAEAGKRAYTRLRQLMLQLEKPDDAHFFFRQEMRCKEFVEDHWWNRVPITLFRWLSDYGYSVARPAAGLALAWLLPGFAYLFHFAGGIIGGTAPVSLLGPFGLSFANLFAFLGLHRLYFGDVLPGLPGWLQALAGAQTVAGVVLLFFLGLGLRNRFRLH